MLAIAGFLRTAFDFLLEGLRFLLTPPMLYVTLAVAVAVGAYTFHVHEVNAAYKRGNDDGVATTTKLYKDQKAQIESQRDLALAAQATAQAEVTADLKAKLAASEERKAKVQIIIKKVPEYVTQKADAQCVITAGFVRLHDDAATGFIPTDTDSPVAGSGPTDVDAPTSFKLSDVGRTVARNYDECKTRGEVIELWQEWYTRSKANFERTMKAQTAPLQPVESTK